MSTRFLQLVGSARVILKPTAYTDGNNIGNWRTEMSNNAIANRAKNFHADARRAGGDDYDLSNPNAVMAAAREESNPRMNAAEWKVMRDLIPTFNKEGCEALIEGAAKFFEEETGFALPYNIGVWGPWVGEARFSRRMTSERREMLETAARAAGWLREATKCPVLVKLMKRTLSDRGMCSPYTTMDVYRLIKRHSSPWAAQRKLCAIQERANQILEPFGFRASWSALGDVLAGKYARRTGRGARAVAEITVAQFFGHNFGERLTLIQARGLKAFMAEDRAVQAWIVARVVAGEFESLRHALNQKGRLVADATDGVELALDPITIEIVHGVEVTDGWSHDGEYTKLLRQVHTNRTYHISNSWHYNKQAVKEAIKEWRKRAALEVKEADFIGFLKGEMGFCPLVVRQDSYGAGNCSAGTESWLHERGWAGREFIPAVWLIPHLDYGLVRNVAVAMYRRYAERDVA